jgi:hypothetical protein
VRTKGEHEFGMNSAFLWGRILASYLSTLTEKFDRSLTQVYNFEQATYISLPWSDLLHRRKKASNRAKLSSMSEPPWLSMMEPCYWPFGRGNGPQNDRLQLLAAGGRAGCGRSADCVNLLGSIMGRTSTAWKWAAIRKSENGPQKRYVSIMNGPQFEGIEHGPPKLSSIIRRIGYRYWPQFRNNVSKKCVTNESQDGFGKLTR